MDPNEEITRKGILNFYNRYKRRRIKPYLKSEPVPESQENAVIHLVGDNFDKIVNNKKKDVFVKYYAPWCGHCKRVPCLNLLFILKACTNLG